MKNLVSIVIPTKNEEKNIGRLLTEIAVNVPFQYEAIVVDDSSDATAFIATNFRARVVKGKGKGLGQAILDGIEASRGEAIVVMDADLSHSPTAIHNLVNRIVKDGYDMAVGSRYVKGGGSEGWELSRRIISRGACLLALPITNVKDATSGFFCFRKSLVDGIKLEASSWKIMLEILLKSRPIRVCEVPINFVVRKEGKSKFNKKQMIAYLQHLVKLAFWKYQRFIKFTIIGVFAAILTLGTTYAMTEWMHIWYMFSLSVATIIAFLLRYAMNVIWTFKVELNPNEPDYEWRSFYKGSLVQKWWKQSIAKTVWSWMPNASSLLDIGCGSSPIITNYYGEEVFGIDSNVGKLKFMEEKCPRHRFNNRDTKQFEDKKFDHVLCIEVLEHLDKPEELIKEISRVVKDDGQVVIATPDYSKWLWKVAERFTPYKEEHVFQFTRKNLEEVCKKYGLKAIRHKYIAGCDLVEEFAKNASN